MKSEIRHIFNALFQKRNYLLNMGRLKKNEKDKKVKYGVSIDRYLFDKMKNEGVSVSKFIQNLVKEHYEKI